MADCREGIGWRLQPRCACLRRPDAGKRNQLADGTDLELRNRLEVLDPVEQRVTFGIQARHWSRHELLASEELRIDICLYFRQEILLMLDDAGFGPAGRSTSRSGTLTLPRTT